MGAEEHIVPEDVHRHEQPLHRAEDSGHRLGADGGRLARCREEVRQGAQAAERLARERQALVPAREQARVAAFAEVCGGGRSAGKRPEMAAGAAGGGRCGGGAAGDTSRLTG